MIPDKLRRAMEKLNRGPITSGRQSREVDVDGRLTPLEAVAPGRIMEQAGGACVVFERALKELFDAPEKIFAPFQRVFMQGKHALGELEDGSEWARLLTADPSSVVFLDIETCGLGGEAIFLVGLLHYSRGDLLMRQFFARDYAEERTMLAAAGEFIQSFGILVTYNGKSFDVPALNHRLSAHGMSALEALPHLDLLHESRRRFRKKLPNCKLQTLEYHICRRSRIGDVPGWRIPGVYRNFLADGDATGIADILHHNILDLVAMVEIAAFIAEAGDISVAD